MQHYKFSIKNVITFQSIHVVKTTMHMYYCTKPHNAMAAFQTIYSLIIKQSVAVGPYVAQSDTIDLIAWKKTHAALILFISCST